MGSLCDAGPQRQWEEANGDTVLFSISLICKRTIEMVELQLLIHSWNAGLPRDYLFKFKDRVKFGKDLVPWDYGRLW